ncbi:MAG: c-type cytochrome, partial [Rickettsiales bacterium]
MSGLELNKLAAAILLAGLVAMIVGKVTHVLYHPDENPEKRGYQIAVEEGGDVMASAAAPEEEEEDITALLASADAAAGEALIKRCVACHTFEKGGPNKVGPNLFGVFGADVGAHPGYSYSDPMQAVAGNWDADKLSHFLKKPKKFVP